MGIKGKISLAAFVLAICGVFVAIAYCAMEQVDTSCTVGAVSSAVACLGMLLAFESWDEQDPGEPLHDLLLNTEEQQDFVASPTEAGIETEADEEGDITD